MDQIQYLQNNREIKTEFDRKLFKRDEQKVEENDKEVRNSLIPQDKKVPDVSSLVLPINNFFDRNRTNVRFSSSESSENSEIRFTVVDAKTGEIIKEFPEENISKLYEITQISSGVGLLVDKNA